MLPQTIKAFAVHIGEYLPNGALLLAELVYNETNFEDSGNTRRESIVFAFTGRGASQPFVTWSRWVTYKTNDECVKVAEDTSWGHYFDNVEDGLKNYLARVEEKTKEQEHETAIRQRGHDDGWNAASWLVDGNTDDPFGVLTRLLEGMKDGDPEIMDQLPSPDVSGQHANAPTWEEIIHDETDIIELSDDGETELWDVYQEAFDHGVEANIIRMRNNYAPEDN